MNTNSTNGSAQIGTITRPEGASQSRSGELPVEDRTRHYGNGVATAPPRIAFTTMPPSVCTPEELPAIATLQKYLIILVTCMVPLAYFPMPSGIAGWVYLACIGLHITGVILTCKLARTMHCMVWPYALGSALPLVNLICFSHITIEASVILRLNGIRVGFLGVSRREMQHFGCPQLAIAYRDLGLSAPLVSPREFRPVS